jgi:hypothetical protein
MKILAARDRGKETEEKEDPDERVNDFEIWVKDTAGSAKFTVLWLASSHFVMVLRSNVISESRVSFSFTLKTENDESIETVKLEEIELTSTLITFDELRGLDGEVSDTVRVMANWSWGAKREAGSVHFGEESHWLKKLEQEVPKRFDWVW